MFSAAGSKVGPHRAALLASSAAGALAAAAAALVPRGEDGPGVDGAPDGARGGASRRASDAGGRFGPLLRGVEKGVLRAGPQPNLNGPNASGRCSCEVGLPFYGKGSRQQTLRLFDRTSNKATLESKYKVDWDTPLGEGGYGAVYLCTDRATGEQRALKMIPKEFTDDDTFQREIDALLRVREAGTHPNICRLKDNFDQKGNFYLVMDLVSGGEMFDHLADGGAYSEADAARLVKETASALAFLHGVGLVHADLKPENLMLSEPNRTSSVIKVVDFGCSEFYKGDNVDQSQIRNNTAMTPAYSPPEAFGRCVGALCPSFDMFSMGCIIYIMLTGRHPFDIEGGATNKEVAYRIRKEAPPLRDSEITAHVSDSAIDLIEKLLDKSPRRRMTAMQMLDHPWVKGETASQNKIANSDQRLKGFKKFKSRLEVKVFSEWITGATSDAAKKTSLMERAFKSLDTNKKGFVTARDFHRSFTGKDEKLPEDGDAGDDPLSLSGFSELISDHMVSKYYPQDHKIFEEGSKGDSIYFINSGTVVVSTEAGFKTTLSQGDLFGEGTLLDSNARRSATIRCATPVHAIRISKEYFLKYMQGGGSDVNITLREQDRARDRDRALKILRLQKNLFERDFSKGDALFSHGEEGKSLFIVEDGTVEIKSETGKRVLDVQKGSICGEHSLITGQPRNATAVCASDKCKVHEMSARDFLMLYRSEPEMAQSFREVCYRRDIQKAMVKKFGKDFSTSVDDLREAFNALDLDRSGAIDLEEIKLLLRTVYPSLSDDDPLFAQALHTLDIDEDGQVKWEEFKKIFA